METQNQDVAHSPAEVPNDPGKMFIGGLSWQTSPGKSPKIRRQAVPRDLLAASRLGVTGVTRRRKATNYCDCMHALFGKM